jgi:hypothetical protein
VKAPEERGQRRAEANRQARLTRGEREEAQGDEIDEDSIDCVEHDGGEVIAGGIHAPDGMVEGEGEPRDGDVVAHVHGGEDPRQLGGAEAAIVRVGDEVLDVVPGEERAPDGGEKRREGRREDQRGKDSRKRAHDTFILTVLTISGAGR